MFRSHDHLEVEIYTSLYIFLNVAYYFIQIIRIDIYVYMYLYVYIYICTICIYIDADNLNKIVSK
jgi:hypothetical protein